MSCYGDSEYCLIVNFSDFLIALYLNIRALKVGKPVILIIVGVVFFAIIVVLVCCCCLPCCWLAKKRTRRGEVAGKDHIWHNLAPLTHIFSPHLPWIHPIMIILARQTQLLLLLLKRWQPLHKRIQIVNNKLSRNIRVVMVGHNLELNGGVAQRGIVRILSWSLYFVSLSFSLIIRTFWR